jgi:glycosyltransferase involved in cell wall biosynthesis
MSVKIKYFPYQPHCFAFGGFDLQMLNTLEAVNTNSFEASRLDIWSRNNDFDIVHIWGMGDHAFKIIDWSKKQGKKTVSTSLLPYFEGLKPKISYLYHSLLKSEHKLQHYYSLLDAVVVLNELQAKILWKYYKVPEKKIEVIPNVVNDGFFGYKDNSFIKKYNIRDYVLCTGNICSRKNQLNLVLACIESNINLVLIGNVLDGEQAYGDKLGSLIEGRTNILWIRELANDSTDYLSAYSNCLVFALPSYDETQPISALEAVAMNKSLLLQQRPYANQKYYLNAELCKSGASMDILNGLRKALRKSPAENPFILECKAHSVGEKYRNLYSKILLKEINSGQ